VVPIEINTLRIVKKPSGSIFDDVLTILLRAGVGVWSSSALGCFEAVSQAWENDQTAAQR
jgi:hypothetical protein